MPTLSLKKVFYNKLLYFYLFYIFLTLLVLQNIFFWDTVQLASKHAQFYFEQNLAFKFLPNSIDSGHIPFFGYLLALIWKVFGRTLAVSHLFMLPFLLGIVYQTSCLIKYFFGNKWRYLGILILLADPTLLSQSTLVSPDIPFYFCFLLLLNSILKNNVPFKYIAVMGLALVSMRGWMAAFILFVFDLISQQNIREIKVKQLVSLLLPYLPGAGIAIVFLFLHYFYKGWIGHHENSPWAESFEKVGLIGFGKNLLIYAWRLIDFGRVTIWLIIIFSIPTIARLAKRDTKFRKLLLLALLLLLIMPFSLLVHKHLLQHRYLLPGYLCAALIVFYVLEKQTKKFWAYLVLTSLLLGNFIIYPKQIAQGWDASLAHLPYYKLREEAIEYLNEHSIPIEETATFFPNSNKIDETNLNNDLRKFPHFSNTEPYVFYSNVFNIDNKDLVRLNKNYKNIKKFNRSGIEISLYKKQ